MPTLHMAHTNVLNSIGSQVKTLIGYPNIHCYPNKQINQAYNGIKIQDPCGIARQR